MGFLKTTTLLLVAFIAFLSTGQTHAHGHNTPQDFVAAHNSVRSPLGLPPVRWSPTVAAFAKHYAASRSIDCVLEHSDGPLGENLAEASWAMTAAEAVKMWADEGEFYDYKTNSCKQGEQCGHYTQMVWRNSVNIGCASVMCRNNNWAFITCNYDPPGNYVNERPY